MSATTSAAYDHHTWSSDDQQRANSATTGAGEFSPPEWNGQNFEAMSDTTYYSPMVYQTTSGPFDNHGTTFDNSSLQPTTSLTSSTAHDTFSPSEYASDAANFGDAFSDYSNSAFDNSFSPFQGPLVNTNIMPSSLLSSPEPASAHTMSPHMAFPSLNTIQSAPGAFQPLHTHQIAVNQPQTQVTRTMNAQKGSRPQLVVTVDEYEDSSSNNEAIQPARRRNSSKVHLSPYPDEDDSSEDEDDPAKHVRVESFSQPIPRSVPSTVRASNVARAGIAPDNRSLINAEDMPSLDDMEKQHRIEEKNAEVADWLSNSDVGSSAGDSLPRRKSKSPRRPRAKSTNDRPFGPSMNVPGPGLTINVPSEMDDEEEYGSMSGSDSPPADIPEIGEAASYFDLSKTYADAQDDARRPSVSLRGGHVDKGVEGITANMAIMRFRQRAQDTDQASVTATLGSRRLSESDIGSIRGAAGISKLLLSPQQSQRAPRRKNSFLGNLLPKLSMNSDNGNKLKRKNSQPVEKADTATSVDVTSPKDVPTGYAAPRRIGSFGRPKTPKVETAVQANGSEVKSPKAATGPATMVRQMWRSRSRSDLGKSPQMGLADLMTKHGGPPIPTLASPLQTRPEPMPINPQSIPQLEDDSDNEDGGVMGDGLTMDLSVRTDMHIIPNLEGFRDQTRQLNPRIQDFLLERVATEQVKRYKRLVETKAKHTENVGARSCNAKHFCLLSGGQSQDLPPRPGNKDPDNALVGFLVMQPGMTDDDLDMSFNGQTMVAAQFPSGVPLPPVPRLPAEFECPLCFKVKKFYKPSDWTKHVHEDVQPFVCTFEGCNESKPFKRKADWVRHENERHRQLESWICSVQECNHTCYRKDNFVQHLVREHKVPDPKARTGRAGSASHAWPNSTTLASEGVDDVWALVDKCHKDSPKLPKDEPCKFCGNICTSWKKLTVHLAKHMEQISMPILPLVEQKKTGSFAFTSQRAQVLPQTIQGTKRFDELPTFLYAEPMSFETEPQSFLGVDQQFMPNAMHTYPPPNAILGSSMPTSQADLTANSLNIANASDPPPSVVSRSRGSSFNEQDFSVQQQGTTYPPIVRNVSTSTPPQHDHSGSQQMYYQQSNGMYMQEPMPMNTVYLTPTSNTPASMGYSPGSSTHSLNQTFGYQQG